MRRINGVIRLTYKRRELFFRTEGTLGPLQMFHATISRVSASIIPFGSRVRCFSVTSAVRSAHRHESRKTLLSINEKYANKQPIQMVTAHDFLTGRMCEKAEVDVVLVGDSLSMTTLGYDDTNELTLEEFLFHVQLVSRGNKSSFIVADLPFGTFERNLEQAIDSLVRIIKEGKVQGIKIEGASPDTLTTIGKLVDIGIPIIGHVGLLPQKHNTIGGFKLQGTLVESALRIYEDCLALQKAGVFGIVLECIPNQLAKYITERLDVPTIGIGAGPHCLGQVLVIADMLGMCDGHIPKFVKKYNNFFDQGVESIKQYGKDLTDKTFPEPDEHGYKIKRDVLAQFKEAADKVK